MAVFNPRFWNPFFGTRFRCTIFWYTFSSIDFRGWSKTSLLRLFLVSQEKFLFQPLVLPEKVFFPVLFVDLLESVPVIMNGSRKDSTSVLVWNTEVQPWQLRQRGVLLILPLTVTHWTHRCFPQELHSRVCSGHVTVPQSSQTARV